MLRKDWVIAMTSSHTLKGSAGYAAQYVDILKQILLYIQWRCFKNLLKNTVKELNIHLKKPFK